MDDEASIITANQTSLLVFSSNTITRFLFIYLFASLVLLVIDIISDVISMSGSRLIVSVWVKVCVRCIPECPLRPDQTLFEQFFL